MFLMMEPVETVQEFWFWVLFTHSVPTWSRIVFNFQYSIPTKLNRIGLEAVLLFESPLPKTSTQYVNIIKKWEAHVKVTDRTHLCSHILGGIYFLKEVLTSNLVFWVDKAIIDGLVAVRELKNGVDINTSIESLWRGNFSHTLELEAAHLHADG